MRTRAGIVVAAALMFQAASAQARNIWGYECDPNAPLLNHAWNAFLGLLFFVGGGLGIYYAVKAISAATKKNETVETPDLPELTEFIQEYVPRAASAIACFALSLGASLGFSPDCDGVAPPETPSAVSTPRSPPTVTPSAPARERSPRKPIEASSAPKPHAGEKPESAAGDVTDDSNRLIVEPALLKRRAPKYPRRAIQANIEGEVDLAFSIERNGAVVDISVTASSAPGWGFESASIEALSGFVYKPATLNGAPVRVDNRVMQFVFRLKDS